MPSKLVEYCAGAHGVALRGDVASVSLGELEFVRDVAVNAGNFGRGPTAVSQQSRQSRRERGEVARGTDEVKLLEHCSHLALDRLG